MVSAVGQRRRSPHSNGSMTAKEYDVLIVGAGPAGSTLAYDLARRGVKTLLVERDVLPRYKT